MAKYIQFYRDAACKNLWATLPVTELQYSGVDAPPGNTQPISGKTYKIFDGSGQRIRNVVQPSENPAFLSSRNTFPEATTLYCKNGFTITLRVADNYQSNQHIDISNIKASGVTLSENSNTASANPIRMWLASINYNGVDYIGFTRASSEWTGVVHPVAFIESSFWDQAFRPPYDYGTEPDGEGGQGNGSIDGTGVHTSPTPSGHVPTGGRGLHIYRISQAGYNSVQNYLWGEGSTLAKTLWQKFMNHNHNPANCICGCFQLPQIFMPPRGAASGVQLGGVNLPTTGTYTTPHLYIDTPIYSLGTITPPFKSWLDYAGVTCKIAVPFCGEIPVPVEKVWNKNVTVQYRCDTFNGNFGAIIKAGGDMIANVTGNAAYQIPIVAGDDGTLERIGAAAAGVLGIVTAGSSAAAMSAAGTAAAGIAGAQYNTFCTNGNTSGNAQSVINGVAYIEYIVPQTAKINAGTYNGAYGMPSCVSGTLSEFTGGYGEFDVSLQEVANVWNATPEEKDEIVKLLEGGVFV